MTPKARPIKGSTDKPDLIKNEIFCSVKDPVNRMKKHGTDREKILANLLSDKGLVSGINKESQNKLCIQKMCKRHEKTCPEEFLRKANKHSQRCATSVAIRELNIKTAKRYHYTPMRMAKINSDNTKSW